MRRLAPARYPKYRPCLVTSTVACLALFFVFLFFERQEPRRGAQRLAIIVDGKIANVEREHAGGTLGVDHDGDGATLDAFAERDLASASESGVREPFHAAIIHHRG